MGMTTRLLRFLSQAAWDLLLPDVVDKPLRIAANFYRCFLAADPTDRLVLLTEASHLTAEQVEQLVDDLAAALQLHLRGGALADEQRDLLRRLVQSLSAAGQTASSSDPAQALRRSLQIEPPAPLPGDRQDVCRSLVHVALHGRRTGGGVRPLPSDAPDIPGYALVGVLGEGAFSTVYLGREADETLVALKVLRLADLRMFDHEVRLLLGVSGDYLVGYRAHGQLQDCCWIALQYVGDHTLADVIHSRPPADLALRLAEQVLRGLDELHRAGVVHRDLKPENAIVGDDYRLRLIDFGFSKQQEGPGASSTVGAAGTALYMSPEQIEGRVTVASDVWAFGCVVYELLVGQPLFEAPTPMAAALLINRGLTRRALRAVPEELRPFLKRCFERDPTRRYADGAEALAAFAKPAAELRARLRHERYLAGWTRIVQGSILEEFAEEHCGELPPDPVPRFLALARRHGVDEVDERRLEELLPPIFARWREVVAAEEAVAHARRELRRDAPRLSREERSVRAARIVRLARLPAQRRRRVHHQVREQLATETAEWGQVRNDPGGDGATLLRRPGLLIAGVTVPLLFLAGCLWGFGWAWMPGWAAPPEQADVALDGRRTPGQSTPVTPPEPASPGPVVSVAGALPEAVRPGLDPDHPDSLLRALVCWADPDFVADPRRPGARRPASELPAGLYPSVLVVGEIYTEPAADPAQGRARRWYLLVETEPNTTPAHVRREGHLGWLPEEQIAPFAARDGVPQAQRDEAVPVHRKCLLVGEPGAAQAPFTDRPDGRGKPVSPRAFPAIYYVYKETETHLFVGDQPAARYADALVGWVPRRRVCRWDTRDAVEFNRRDARLRPAALFQSKADAAAYLACAAPPSAADLGPGGAFAPRPLALEDLAAPAWKHFRPRMPLVSGDAEAQGSKPNVEQRICQIAFVDDGALGGDVPTARVGWLVERDPWEPVPGGCTEAPPSVRCVVLVDRDELCRLHKALSAVLDQWDEDAPARTWQEGLRVATGGPVAAARPGDTPADMLAKHLGLPPRSIGKLHRTFGELRDAKADELATLRLDLQRAVFRVADVILEQEATYTIEKDPASGQEIVRRAAPRPRPYWWGADPARPEFAPRAWVDRDHLP